MPARRLYATRNFVLIVSRLCGLRLARSIDGFAQDGLDHFALVLLRRDVAPEDNAESGDLKLYDLSQPFEIDALSEGGVMAFTALWVSRARILRSFSNELALHGLSLTRALPVADIVASALDRFSRRADVMTLDEFDAAATGLVDLAASAINQRLKAELGPALGSPVKSFLSIRRYIDQNLKSPGLDADKLAAVFGLSRASLYRLFEPVGGVGTYIRSARLARAHQEITAPQNANFRPGHIALRLGFPSATAFGRLFRETYGISPKEARRRALDSVADEHMILNSCGQPQLSAFLRRTQK